MFQSKNSMAIQPYIVMHELTKAKGRVIFIARDRTLYRSEGYHIYRSSDSSETWFSEGAISSSPLRALVSAHRLGARLLRHDIIAFGLLSNGVRIAVARDGLYRAREPRSGWTRVFAAKRGSRPLNLCVDNKDNVLFGEYRTNRERSEVHIYVSTDEGRTFFVGYTFPPKTVRHVHNILYDETLGAYWVFVGDYGEEPGIGLLNEGLSHIEWIVRGRQQARVVGAIHGPDCLYFGTDTELQQNFIMRLDKKTGVLNELVPVSGSSLYASKFGSVYAISTCVEPSAVNRSQEACLYVSGDGENWSVVRSYVKDRWQPRLFQYGTIVLPTSQYTGNLGAISGQAVVEADNIAIVAEFVLQSQMGL
jgi:hypothetical protein